MQQEIAPPLAVKGVELDEVVPPQEEDVTIDMVALGERARGLGKASEVRKMLTELGVKRIPLLSGADLATFAAWVTEQETKGLM